MAEANLKIDDCMSPSPYSIETGQTMAQAHAIMRAHQIRHLPVLNEGRLVGLVSSRDLLLMETLEDVDPTKVNVDEAMTEPPYTVEVGTQLREVALNMYSRKFGSAVVMDGDKVVGVFTTVDALRVLANVL